MLLRARKKRRKRGGKERGGREGRMRDRGKTKEGAIVCQSVLGRLAENSGHVRPCETF